MAPMIDETKPSAKHVSVTAEGRLSKNIAPTAKIIRNLPNDLRNIPALSVLLFNSTYKRSIEARLTKTRIGSGCDSIKFTAESRLNITTQNSTRDASMVMPIVKYIRVCGDIRWLLLAGFVHSTEPSWPRKPPPVHHRQIARLRFQNL